MDYKDPKTRKEKKGSKEHAVFNQKTIRLKAALAEKRAISSPNTKTGGSGKK